MAAVDGLGGVRSVFTAGIGYKINAGSYTSGFELEIASRTLAPQNYKYQ
jgi:hypothetical protein